MPTSRENGVFGQEPENTDFLAPLPSELPDEPEDGWNLTEPEDEDERSPLVDATSLPYSSGAQKATPKMSLLDSWKSGSGQFAIPDIESVQPRAEPQEEAWASLDWEKGDADGQSLPGTVAPGAGPSGYAAAAAFLGSTPIYYASDRKHTRLKVQRLNDEGLPLDIGHLPPTASDEDLIKKFQKPGIYYVWPIDQFGRHLTTDPVARHIPSDHEYLLKVTGQAAGKGIGTPSSLSAAASPLDAAAGLLTFLKDKERQDAVDRQMREARLHEAQERLADERLRVEKAYAGIASQTVDQTVAVFTALLDKDSKRHDETYKELTRFHQDARAVDRDAHQRDMERQQTFANNQITLQTSFMDKMVGMQQLAVEERKAALLAEQLMMTKRLEEDRLRDERRRDEERREEQRRRDEWLANQDKERAREKEHQLAMMQLMQAQNQHNNPMALMGSLFAMAAPVLGALKDAGMEPKDLLGGLFGGGAPEPAPAKSWFGDLLDFGRTAIETIGPIVAGMQVEGLEEDEEYEDEEEGEEEAPRQIPQQVPVQSPHMTAPPQPAPASTFSNPIPDGYMQVPPPPAPVPPPQTVHDLTPEQRKAARQIISGLVGQMGQDGADWSALVQTTFSQHTEVLAAFLSGTTIRRALNEAGATDAMVQHVIQQFDAAGVDASIPRG